MIDTCPFVTVLAGEETSAWAASTTSFHLVAVSHVLNLSANNSFLTSPSEKSGAVQVQALPIVASSEVYFSYFYLFQYCNLRHILLSCYPAHLSEAPWALTSISLVSRWLQQTLCTCNEGSIVLATYESLT